MMTALSSLSMVLFQSADAPPPSSERTLLIIFIGIVAISLALNAIVSMMAGLKVMAAVKEMKALVHDLHGKATPILLKTDVLIDDLGPKIRTVSENVEQISYTVREKVDQVGETLTQINRTVGDANLRTRGQVAHVDRMVSSALESTEDITRTVAHGIRGPVKQVAGLIAGVRVGVETLLSNFAPKKRPGSNDTEF